MGRSRLLLSLLLLSLLELSVASGYGRKEMGFVTDSTITRKVVDNLGKVEVGFQGASYQQRRRQMVVMVEDYADPGANTNPRNGPLVASPPPPAARH